MGDRKARACVTTQGRWERVLASTVTITRDFGSMAAGLWAFVHEEQTGKVNGLILLAAIALVGGAPALRFAQLLRSASTPPTGSPSEQPEPSSSPSSPSTS
jgi:hypothetical protein